MAEWEFPTEVTDADIAFPARGPELTPNYDELPDDFRCSNMRGRHEEVFIHFDLAKSLVFFYADGVPLTDEIVFEFNEGITVDAVQRHVQVLVGTFGTKHEHKICGLAWLLSLWMKDIHRE